MTIQAKIGAMVAYQGDVSFEHAGSGGMGRLLKKAVTGEGHAADEDHGHAARSSWPTWPRTST